MGVYSQRIGAEVHFGKLDAKPVRDAISFPEARKVFVAAGGQLPPLPANFGYGGDFRGGAIDQGGWGMLGNGPCDDDSIDTTWAAWKGAGDCYWAGSAHEEMEAAKNSGRPTPRFTALNILQQYGAYSGYELQPGANDNGTVVADGIKWRQDKGLLDADGNAYKIGQSFELTPGNLQQAWEAAFLLENVGVGVKISEANMQQFDAGTVWDYVASAPIVGGHYIVLVGRSSADDSGFLSWAHRVGGTQAFYENQNDEAVGFLDMLRYSQVTGKTAEHFSEQDIELFFSMLAKGLQ